MGKIEGENFCRSTGTENFAEKTFTECQINHIGGWGMPKLGENLQVALEPQNSSPSKVSRYNIMVLCVIHSQERASCCCFVII